MAIIGNGNQTGKDESNRPAIRVLAKNENGIPLKVEIGNKGITKNIYDNANAVPVNTETLINSYTVPVGKGFDLNAVSCSGNNIARFIIKVNSSIIQAKRTWWGGFNCDFNIIENILAAGDKVEIFVENNGETAEFFESTIIGGEYDE